MAEDDQQKEADVPLTEEYLQRPPSPKFVQKTKRKKEMIRNGKMTGKIHHIPLASSAIVEVVQIESPSAFWVRPYNHITPKLILEEPTSEPLEQFYQFGRGELKMFLHKYCMAPLEEVPDDSGDSENLKRRYGRARIVETYGNELARVLFIDDGRLLWVRSNCLAQMPAEFYYHPWQAMYMCMGDVLPVDPAMDEGTLRWSEQQVNAFRETIGMFELFKIQAIKSTVLYDDYSRAHLVHLYGLSANLLDRVSQINVDIGGLFASKCQNSIINSPTFNAATFIPAKSPLVAMTDEVTDPRYESFPDRWQVEESDERIEKRNIIAGENLKSWPFNAENSKFQIPHIDMDYLKNNGYINKDGTVSFHIFGCYLQSPYEFYGAPYKRVISGMSQTDETNATNVIEHEYTLREASYALIEARKELANTLDIFYRKKYHRIPLNKQQVAKWLADGIRVYAICNCSGLERRKRFGTYQRVEVISAPEEYSENYRLRFVDTGGIVPQVHSSEIHQLHPKHCQQMAVCMQLCWHGVRDSHPDFSSKKIFQAETLETFKENFYCDGPIRLTLLGTNAPNREARYGKYPTPIYEMWNVTCVSLIELDPSITDNVNLLKVLQFEETCVPNRLVIDPRIPFEFVDS